MTTKNIFSFLSVVFFLFLVSCQDDAEVQRKETTTINSSAGKSASARVGNHDYWYFFRGDGSANIRYAYSDNGTTWGGNVALNNGAQTSTGVGAAYFNGKFIVVYKGASTNNIFYSYSTDGLNWLGNTQIPSAATDNRPTLAIWRNRLWVFYSGVNNDEIWYMSSTDGTNWSSPNYIYYPGQVTDKASGPVEVLVNRSFSLDDAITLFYSHSSDGYRIKTRYATLENAGNITFTGSAETVTGCDGLPITTNAGVSAALFNGFTYIAYKSFDNNRLNIIKRRGCAPTYDIVFWANSNTSDQPSLISKNNKVTVIYRGQSTSPIKYSYSTDGQNWSGNVNAAGDTRNGGPSFLLE